MSATKSAPETTVEQRELLAGLMMFKSMFRVMTPKNFPEFRVSGGVKYLAEEAKLPWFINTMLNCEQRVPEVADKFHEWEVNKVDDDLFISCSDEHGILIKAFKVGKVTFPLDGLVLMNINKVLGLPGEFGM